MNRHAPRESAGPQGPAAASFESLEPRQLLSTSPNGTDPWAPYATIIAQDQAVAQYPFLNGTTVRIAVVDRGIDYNHPQLGGGIGIDKTVMTGWNFRDNDSNVLDDYGHGTGVAGIIAASGYTTNGVYNQGVAPDVQIIDLKQEGSANIKQCLDWIIQNASKYNIQVVNVTDFVTDENAGSSDPSLYTSELQTLHDMGIFICTPVGNDEIKYGPGYPIGLPAADPNVFGAGGIQQDDTMNPDSRRGPGLDLLGPSYNVTMPYYQKNPNTTGYSIYDDQFDGTPIITQFGRGTSWASAYTSGTAVLLKQIDRTLTPDQIATILKNSGDPVADPEQVGGVTSYPRLNVLKAIQLAYQTADPGYLGNYSLRRAKAVTFKRGSAILSGQKLLVGRTEAWSVTIPDTRTVYVKTNYTGPTKLPLVNLINSKGVAVGAVTSRGLSARLTPGTYFLYYQPIQSLVGTYGFSMTTLSVGSKVRREAVTATPAVATPSTATSAAATSAASSDIVLGKRHTSVFAA
jgi:hypothetical protein